MQRGFYKCFEDRFRGSRELIRSRLDAYARLLALVKSLDHSPRLVDLGCGRGEWLEFVGESGIEAIGADVDDDMLKECRDRSLSVANCDAVEFLKKLPDGSHTIVSSFHLVEHLSFENLQSLMSEAFRVLKPTGILLLETPNPENVLVATSNFYLDPTHLRPLPSPLLTFLAEYAGFESAQTYRLNSLTPAARNEPASLTDVLLGVGADYCIVAFKSVMHAPAGEERRNLFPSVPSLLDMASRFDEHIKSISTAQDSGRANTSDTVEPAQHTLPVLVNSLTSLSSHIEQNRQDACALKSQLANLERQLETIGAGVGRMAPLNEASASAIASLKTAQDALLRELDESRKSLIERDQRLERLMRRVSDLSGWIQLSGEREASLKQRLAQLEQDAALGQNTRPTYRSSQPNWIIDGAHAWLTLKPGSRPRRTVRRVSEFARWFHLGTSAWITLKPGSRPRRYARVLHRKLRGEGVSSADTAANATLASEEPGTFLVRPSTAGAIDAAFLPLSVAQVYRGLLNIKNPNTQKIETETPKKQRLAYLSPLPPQKSGISDYSAELLPELSAYYDIDVITQQTSISDPWICKNLIVRDVAWFEQNAHTYDRVLYHFGNSEFHSYMIDLLDTYPGVVVLHDFFLGHLMAYMEMRCGRQHYWTRALYESHGIAVAKEKLGISNFQTVLDRYPANLSILLNSQGIIVHSEYSKKLAAIHYGEKLSAKFHVTAFPRKPPTDDDRLAARTALGVSPDDLVVCSFGMIASTKLNHKLVQAWLDTELPKKKNNQLVFVGQDNPDDSYAIGLRKQITASGLANQIKITGFVDREMYVKYLLAADLAVQLRATSRGETSAAVFDCLAHGVPTIINANGSMAEIPIDSVMLLPDECGSPELAEAISTISSHRHRANSIATNGRALVKNKHTPGAVAKRYHELIESITRDTPTAKTVTALGTVAARMQDKPAADRQWITAARELAIAKKNSSSIRQLLFDVSILAVEDLKTGVQRVVRAQLNALLSAPALDCRVEAVRLVRTPDGLQYVYARSYMCKLMNLAEEAFKDEPIDVSTGDVLYVADLNAAGTLEAAESGIYNQLRQAGIQISFLVYDILPIQNPDWFPEGTDVWHTKWLCCVADVSTNLICISNSVADDVSAWLKSHHSYSSSHAPKISALPLGADIETSAPTSGLPTNANDVLSAIKSRTTFLAVGTIEPRKGYLELLSAFEILWNEGVDINLVIIGAEGWKAVPEAGRRTIPTIARRLADHSELGKRLWWHRDASDEYLEEIYRASKCLIAASEGEGFGLPIIEAARHGIPVLARDLRVFREVAGSGATYFSSLGPADLAHAIKNWLHLSASDDLPKPTDISSITWAENTDRLRRLLLSS